MAFFEESELFWIILIRAVLCSIILRIGYMIVHIGKSSSGKIETVINQNIIEFAVASFSFFVFGRSLIFSDEEEKPITSNQDNLFVGNDQEIDKIARTLYVWTAMISTTTIYTAATAGRIHTVGHIILTAFIAGFIHPLAMRWTWNSDSFMKDATFLGYKVTYPDCASFPHVHLLVGTASLFTATFLGGNLRKQRSSRTRSEFKSTHISFGYFLVLLGTFGLTIPLTSPLTEIELPQWTSFDPESYESLVANNAIAAFAGYSVAIFFQFVATTDDSWFAESLQSALAGMVAAASGIYFLTPATSLIMGVIGGLTYLVIRNVSSTDIEDQCNVIKTHFICGIVGSLYPKKTSMLSLNFGKEDVVNFMWVLVCNLVLHMMFTVSLVTILTTLDCLGYVRSNDKKGRCTKIGGSVERDEELGDGYFRLVKRRQRIRKKH